MNSFDVFDTLIARRFLTSDAIFEQIAKEFKIADFVERRKRADTGTRNLRGIYDAMGLGRELMARELALEHEHAIPIQENLDRVQHGDLLLSDMYLESYDILSILRSAGLNKQVTVYRSNAGKLSGDTWRRLGANKPDLHLGDNKRSDFEVPRSFGITCELCQQSQLTEIESYLLNNGLPSLAFLMREIRLRGTYRKHRIFFDIACQLNLPWLLIVCEMLHRKDKRPKVFLGRDCQLMHLIYNRYYQPSYYLPFSRKAAFARPREAVQYLLSNAPEGALFVDISSTGATWELLQAPLDVTVIIYSDLFHYTKEKPILPKGFSYLTKNSECGQTNALVELFNCGDHGYLGGIDSYDESILRATFAETDIDPEIVAAIHAPSKVALGLAAYYQASIISELNLHSDRLIFQMFSLLTSKLCRQGQAESLVAGLASEEAEFLASVRQIAK